MKNKNLSLLQLPAVWIILIFISLSGCNLAPTYHRPELDISTTYKELSGEWLVATPERADMNEGRWWEMYEDLVLNELEEKVILNNQDLKVALANYDQARALLAVAQSAYFPFLIVNADMLRQHASKTTAHVFSPRTYNDWLVPVDLTYEVDLWGQVRNAVAAARDTMQSTAAQVAAVQLSLQAELASNYYSLRGSDDAQRVLDEVVIVYEKAVYLTRNRYKGGADSIEAYYQAQTQLEAARTLSADIRATRAQLEHAIAVLIGEVPANFSIKPTTEKPKKVIVSPELPSTLLERRPDIATAERLVAAANANIGVARSAFFPLLNLTGSAGFESQSFGKLFEAPSLIWSIGPTVTQPIFEGGKLVALTDQAWAQYCGQVAAYRQTVLQAFQEVEDSLVALHQLAQEIETQTAAAKAAQGAVDQANYRYKGGIATFLDVYIEQNTALQTKLTLINIQTRYQLASVQLIQALGGGWNGGI